VRIFSVSDRTDARAMEVIIIQLPPLPLCLARLRMPRNLECPVCRVPLQARQRREDHVEHRQPFLDQISYPVALIVAGVLGFEGALIALGVSEAAKAKPAPPSAFGVEMAKPPYCSIKTPDRLFFL
jgi:hypothetical protein